MEIRTMQPTDYADVYAVWINCPGLGLNDVDDSEEGIVKYLQRNPGTSFVALDGERIIGTILAGHDGRRGTIYHTAVLPECQGRGIGRKLVKSAVNALEEQGIAKIFLVVYSGNETGNSFWTDSGFAERTDLVYRDKTVREMRRIDT